MDTPMRKQITSIRHDPSYKQLEVKTTIVLMQNRNGHHNTEHIIGQHQQLKRFCESI